VGRLTFPFSPSKEQGWIVSQQAVTNKLAVSHEVGSSIKFCLHRSSRTVGLPAPTWASLFPTSLAVFRPVPSPRPLLVGVHPLMRFTSPTEHFSIFTRPGPPACTDKLEHLPWGSDPLRDTSVWSPLTVSFPRPT